MDFAMYNGYEAVEEKDNDFKPFKQDGAVCEITEVSLETGDKEWNMGHELASLTLVVSEGDNVNRRIWKRFDLDSETGTKSFKQTLFNIDPKLAELNSQEELEANLAALKNMLVVVNCWVGKKDGKEFQNSKIKGSHDGTVEVTGQPAF